ncbi:carbohydrate ABC transporter permease [Rubrimonas sp.]|uniref:carbohydrate ABC transporter permease n=1 Tax=Rubrimonas sp. TaxID=2036015 RepID=UPI002FDDE6C8
MRFASLMLAPLAALLLATLAWPILFSGWISLHDWRLTRLDDVRFLGLENFEHVLGDGAFWNALRNTGVFVGLAVSLELLLGLALAVHLRRFGVVRRVAQALLLAPMFVTPIAVGLTFRFMMNAEFGVIPWLLSPIATVDWFGRDMALFSLVLIDVWQWTPFMLLMFLAGLEALPKAPFEAARVDGAGPWLTFRALTLPMLRPVIVVAVVIRALDAFKVFEYVFAITRGGPGVATETMQFHIYQVGFRFFRMGEAAAAAFLLAAILLLGVAAFVAAARRSR